MNWFHMHILRYFIAFRWQRIRLRTREQIDRHQKKKFTRLQSKLACSEYYKEYSSCQQLAHFPRINKKSFMRHFDEINTAGVKKQMAKEVAMQAEETRDFSPQVNGVTVGLSSGTSGNKGIFLASNTERAKWVAAILDRVIGWSFKPRKVAFFLRANSNLYSAVKSKFIRFSFFDLRVPMPLLIDNLSVFAPDILVAQPSVLIQIAQLCELGTLTLSPSKVISVAEVLEPQDRAFLSSVFNQTIHEVYQCTEGFLASTCEFGTLHFNEDNIIVEKEYLSGLSGKFYPVITDLERSTQPIVRYVLDDIIEEGGPCPCGSPFSTIHQIVGRSDDVLSFRDDHGTEILLFPDFVRRAIVMASEDIRSYQVVQRGPNSLECYLKGIGARETIRPRAKAALINMLAEFGITGVSINFVESLTLSISGKLKRVTNASNTKI